MEEDKNEEMLRNTVKSKSFDNEKSHRCNKKNTIIILIVSVILLVIGIGIFLYFHLRDKGDKADKESFRNDGGVDDDKYDNITVINGLLQRQFSDVKDRFRFKIEETN